MWFGGGARGTGKEEGLERQRGAGRGGQSSGRPVLKDTLPIPLRKLASVLVSFSDRVGDRLFATPLPPRSAPLAPAIATPSPTRSALPPPPPLPLHPPPHLSSPAAMLRAAATAASSRAAAAAAARGVRRVSDRVSGHAGLKLDPHPHEVRFFRVFFFCVGGRPGGGASPPLRGLRAAAR